MSASDFPPSQFPPPLLAKLESPLERSILSAASADAPSAESKEALLRSLGALGVLGAAAATTATVTSSAGIAAKSTLLLTATKVAIGVAVVTAVAGGAWSVRESRTPKQAIALPAAATQAASIGQMSRNVTTAAVVPAPEPSEPAAATAAVLPAAPPAAAPHHVHAATAEPSPEPPKADDLAQEANALATVRSALARGDVAAANRGLEAYAAAFPNGQLQPEAEILRARVNKKITGE